jgi:thiol-disulfide isomerase/thioredoxin
MRSYLVLLFVVVSCACFSQEGFLVSGNLEGLSGKKIRVNYTRNGRSKVDTLTTVNGDSFTWTGNFSEPQIVRIEVLDTSLYLRIGKAVAPPPPLMFMLANAKVEVQGNAKEIFKARVSSADKEMQTYEEYRSWDIGNYDATWKLQQEHHRKTVSGDTAGNARLTAEMTALRKQNQRKRMEFIDSHPDAFASVLMMNSLILVMSNEDMQRRFEAISDRLKQSASGQALAVKIENNKITAVGKPVVHLQQEGIDGNEVNTRNMTGKVILLDFWGSWCVPCRKSHPELKTIYERYRGRGFEIVGISNESVAGAKSKAEQTERWKKAVVEDAIPWKQVLYDPAINDIVKTYDINGYPTKILVDAQGKIVLRLLGISERNSKTLEAKLQELLGVSQ